MPNKRPRVRIKKLNIAFTREEYEWLVSRPAGNSYRNITEFIRDLLFKKPISIEYREQALDDFIPAAAKLKEELNSISIALGEAIDLLRSAGPSVPPRQLEAIEATCFSILQKTDEIKILMFQTYDKCTSR